MVGFQAVLQQVAPIVRSYLGNLGLVLTVHHICVVGGKATGHSNNIEIVEVVVRSLDFTWILDKDALCTFATLCLGNVEIVVQFTTQLISYGFGFRASSVNTPALVWQPCNCHRPHVAQGSIPH